MIEVDGKGDDRLREDSHTGPDCGDGQRAFRSDDGLFVASAMVSERSTWFTACSNSCELLRFSPLRKIEIMALLNFDTVA